VIGDFAAVMVVGYLTGPSRGARGKRPTEMSLWWARENLGSPEAWRREVAKRLLELDLERSDEPSPEPEPSK
jgi:hypothetical protein